MVPPTTAAVHTPVRSNAAWKMPSDSTVAKLASPAKPRTRPKREDVGQREHDDLVERIEDDDHR